MPPPTPAVSVFLLIAASFCPPAAGQDPGADPLDADRRHRSQELGEWIRGERARIAERLADTVVGREVAAREAEAELRKAGRAREVAESDVKIYVEGVYPQELLTRQQDLKFAQDDRRRNTDRLAALRAAEARGQRVPPNTLEIAGLNEVKSKFALEEAETALQVLERYERGRNLKSLGAKVDEARQAEQLAQLRWDRRRQELAHRQQLADDARTRSPEDLLVNLLDKVVRGEGELARLAREAGAANEAVIKDPASAEARAKVEAIRKSLQAQADATRDALRDAVELADETANLRQRYADAEKRIIAERKAALHLPPGPTDQPALP